jgi:cell wall-associated NlpC family hydrolase
MVGRLVASLTPLVIAALAAAQPATAQPQRLLLLGPLAQPTALTAGTPAASIALSVPTVAAIPAIPAVAAAAVAAPARATAFGETPDASELSDPSEPAAAPERAAPAARRDGLFPAGPADPADAAPTPAAAAPPSPAPPVPGDALLESGEYGVEYQLSVRDAESFLDHLAARYKRLVEQAMTYLGTPYRRGGTSRRGLDCSGLVGAVYGEQGLEMPRTAAEQFGEGMAVGESDLRPGDLVFFRDTYKRGISHVGIYIGDGRFIHAAGRRRGVVVSELSRPYYHSRYAGARRLAAQPADRTSAQVATASAGSTTPAAVMASGPR